MRKLFVFAVCIALCIAMAVPAFAASKAKTPASDLKVMFEDDFSGDEIDTDNWFLCQGVKIVDGGMNFANDGNWINGGYSATYIPEDDYIENYVLDFDFTSNAQDCYFGVGVRAQSGGNSNFQNGGRFQVPSAAELGTGISFDLAISKNQNASAVGYIGVCLNNGGAYGDAPQFLVAYPDGFDGKSGHVTIVDLGDLITLYVNNVEVVTLTLSGSNVKAYNANGDEIFSTSEADYPDEGSFSFYQRNNSYRVDNVKVSEFKEGAAAPAGGLRDFAADKGDKMSYDQILVNGAEIANGNDAVIAAKALVDGSDGSIQNVAMHGWYGNANSKIESFGYSIDGGDPVYGDFKVATTQDVIDAGGESRYTIVIDVTSLTDGETHKIQALAKLQNGDIVKLNRNADGKDRDAYVNYKAQLVEEPVTEPTTQETQPQTGDATVAMFAVLAVLALGAAVVFAKKRSF